jgi:hypothetical protein
MAPFSCPAGCSSFEARRITDLGWVRGEAVQPQSNYEVDSSEFDALRRAEFIVNEAESKSTLRKFNGGRKGRKTGRSRDQSNGASGASRKRGFLHKLPGQKSQLPQVIVLTGVIIAALLSAALAGIYLINRPEPTSAGISWNDAKLTGVPESNVANVKQVSCASAHFCGFVGSYQSEYDNKGGFGAFWDGKQWSSAPLPSAISSNGSGNGSDANVISCVKPTFCAVGGSYVDGNGNTQAFTATSNGSQWKIDELGGEISNSPGSSPRAISCASSTFCVVGGEVGNGSDYPRPLMFTWDGNNWYQSPTTISREVDFVSCVSSQFCMAIGGSSVAEWNGANWISLPSLEDSLQVTSLSCSSSEMCAIGGSDGNQQAFASVWNGYSWQTSELVTALNDLNHNDTATVSAVICPSVSFCVVGGSYASVDGGDQAFVSMWSDGHWLDETVGESIANNSSGVASTDIVAISCASSRHCVAAGSYVDGLDIGAFRSTWNGGEWSDRRLQSNEVIGDSPFVSDLACPVINDCIFTGSGAE